MVVSTSRSKGLTEKCIRAKSHRFEQAGFGGRRDDQHRDAGEGRLGAALTKEIPTAAAGQHEVEHNH